MLKFFYRLKRRGGAVLFAVIAIMSLLIAMAITAYFTARSSYQTVVSNYDFSQMYLSAISVSDMMIEAITQDTYAEKDGIYDINKFDELKKAVQTLKKTKGSSLTGTSSNIYGKSGSAVLTTAAEDPVEPGVLDAVSVEITHSDNYPEVDALTGNATGLTIYIFEIKTTAYYRDNSITVSDMVLNKAGKTTNKSAGTPFNTFFTATGQTLAGSKVDKDHTRVVTIQSHEISDNAYFENDVTVFPQGNNNDFYGGIQATGDVYLDKFISHIPNATSTTRHDWWIGGDLVTGVDANDLDLKNNNLYVKRDLILGGNGATITAGDVYVMGDLYLCSGGTVNIKGNLYVQGNIYYGADDEINGRVNNVGGMSGCYLSLGTTGEFKVSGTLKVNGSFTKSNNGTDTSGTWDPSSVTIPVSSIVANTKDDTYDEKITDLGLEAAVTSKSKTTVFDTYTADQDTIDHAVTVNLDEMDGVLPPSDLIPLGTLTKSVEEGGYGGSYHLVTTGGVSLSQAPWYIGNATTTLSQSYSGGGISYKKTIVNNDTGAVVYSEECFVDASGNVVVEYDDGTKAWRTSTGAVYEMADGTQITATRSGSNITIDIPYSEDGYLLGLELGGYNTSNLTYNFDVDSGETMPVVLKANFNDGSSTATDGDGNNAFSWRAGDTGNGCESKVKVVGDGNVMFELGNYNKTSGEYVPYLPDETTSVDDNGEKTTLVDYSDLQANVETATYFVCQKETVGTEKQVDKVSGNWQSESTIRSMLGTGSKPAADYDNRVMIVSNKNGGVAVDGARLDNTICGYIYAPNGVYDNASGAGNSPIFGGMIVSSYKTNLSYFIYCEPQPSVISDILGSMTQSSPSGGTSTPADGYWLLSGVGKNYLG